MVSPHFHSTSDSPLRADVLRLQSAFLRPEQRLFAVKPHSCGFDFPLLHPERQSISPNSGDVL